MKGEVEYELFVVTVLSWCSLIQRKTWLYVENNTKQHLPHPLTNARVTCARRNTVFSGVGRLCWAAVLGVMSRAALKS